MFIFHRFFHGFSAMHYFVVNISMASPPSRMRKGRPWRGRWPYIYIYIRWCIRGIYCQLAANFASWKFPIAAHQGHLNTNNRGLSLYPMSFLCWNGIFSDMLVLAEIFLEWLKSFELGITCIAALLDFKYRIANISDDPWFLSLPTSANAAHFSVH